MVRRVLRLAVPAFAVPVLAAAALMGATGGVASASAGTVLPGSVPSGSVPPGSVPPGSGAACTGISVSVVFTPPSVPAGQPSVATVTGTNCTGVSLQADVLWRAEFASPGVSGIPPGCPAIDPPPPTPVTLAPGQSVSASRTYLTFASCMATELRLTAVFEGANGAILGQGTGVLNIEHVSTGDATAPRAGQAVSPPR